MMMKNVPVAHNSNDAPAIRVAKVLSTGNLYVVQYVDKRAQMCYAFGEVLCYHGMKITHEKTWKSFPLVELELQDISLDLMLVKRLFDQSVRNRVVVGKLMVKKCGTGEIFDLGRNGYDAAVRFEKLKSSQVGSQFKAVMLNDVQPPPAPASSPEYRKLRSVG